jgi:hypothetical protein
VKFEKCQRCPFALSGQPIPPPTPKVGNVFASKLKEKWNAEIPPGKECGCDSVKTEMNALGPEGCLRKADHFAGKVVENLNASDHWQRKLPDLVKRTYLRMLIKSSARYVRDWKPLETP